MIKPNLCDYSGAYILVNGNIEDKADNASEAFKDCAPFTKCITHINNEHLETAENLDIMMPMYNLLEYCNNYEESSGNLYQFKRDEPPPNNRNVSLDTSSSFKYKSNLLGNEVNNVKIVVPSKYLSNFFRSLEMPLINCKIHLELDWTRNCVLSSANGDRGDVSFKITATKLYVPIVTLSTKDNVNLTKQLNEGFKRSVYWNEYASKIESKEPNNDNVTRFPLDALFQGVSRLFFLAFNNTTVDVADNPINQIANRVQRDSYRKYFLPRVNLTKYNVLIDGRNFYDQLISDQLRKYDEVRKIATGKGDDYTTGCLLDYQYFKENDQLIAVDLSKQKELDANPRAIQQLNFMVC